jgi:hypothetical protein
MYFEIFEDKTGQYNYFLEGPDNVSKSEYDFHPSETLKKDIPYLLNEMGADGWEVIQIDDNLDTPHLNHFQVWLKRPMI